LSTGKVFYYNKKKKLVIKKCWDCPFIKRIQSEEIVKIGGMFNDDYEEEKIIYHYTCMLMYLLAKTKNPSGYKNNQSKFIFLTILSTKTHNSKIIDNLRNGINEACPMEDYKKEHQE